MWRVLALLLTVCTGLLVTGHLALNTWVGTLPKCGPAATCDRVLTHPISHPWGVPLSYVGFAAFLVLALLAAAYAIVGARIVLKGVQVISTLGFALSLGLQLYSYLVIHGLCPWCLATFAAFGSVATLSCRPKWSIPRRYSGEQALTVVGTLYSLTAMGLIVTNAVLTSNARDAMVDLVAVRALKESDVLDHDAISSRPGGKPTYVAIYNVGCGSCAASFQAIEPECDRRKARLVIRFLDSADRQSEPYRVAHALEGLGRDDGYKLAREWLQTPVDNRNSVKLIAKANAMHRSDANRAKTSFALTEALTRRLKFPGTPVMLEVLSPDAVRCVNPLTLEPY